MRSIKKRRENTKLKKIGNSLYAKCKEFCESTDLHGYKYIFMRNASLFERVCWCTTIFACTAIAIVLVMTAWRWFSKNPTVTVIESTHGAIWNIPFPSVIVCDINLISKRAAFKFANNISRVPANTTRAELFDYLRFVPILYGHFEMSNKDKYILNILQETININKITIAELISNLTVPCNKMIERCAWKNTVYGCDLLFRRIGTSIGQCCAFNYFAVDPPDDWLRTNEIFRITKPRRVAACGYQTALTILLNIDVNDYYSTELASHGVNILIDDSYNFPERNSPLRLINPKNEVFIAISPEMTYSTPGVIDFPVEERSCKFTSEVEMKNLKRYSFHNCFIEKNGDFIQSKCGCIPYFMESKSVRVCDFTDTDCIISLSRTFYKVTSNKNDSNYIECYPECEHHNYPLQVSSGLLVRRGTLNALTFFKDIIVKNHSLVNVYYNDLVSTRYRRDVYLNWQNLLASFGGLLSLFLGFTLISGVDFIIFIIMKTILDPCLNRNKKNLIINSSELNKSDAKSEGVKINSWLDNRKAKRNKRIKEKDEGLPNYKETIRY